MIAADSLAAELSDRERRHAYNKQRLVVGLSAVLAGFPIAAVSLMWAVIPPRLVLSMGLLGLAVLLAAALARFGKVEAGGSVLIGAVSIASVDGFLLTEVSSTAVFFPTLSVALAYALFSRSRAAGVSAMMVGLTAAMACTRVWLDGDWPVSLAAPADLSDLAAANWFSRIMDPTALALSVAVLGWLGRRGTDDDHRQLLRIAQNLQSTRADLQLSVDQAQRHAAEAEQEVERRTRFFSRASHELRTPLNAVIGYTELLLEDEPTGAITEDLQSIREAAHQQLTLVDQLLVLSAPQSELAASLEDVELDTVADRLRRAYADEAKLQVDVAAGCVRTDPEIVHQILTELVSNAVRFAGDAEIEVTLRPESAGFVVVVTDDGPGFEVDPGHEFAAFAQSTSADARQGAGLGLARVAQLVDLLGGQRTLVSNTDGTTVTLVL